MNEVPKVYDPEQEQSAEYSVPASSTAFHPAQGIPLNKCPTNLDLSTRRGKALAIAAGNPSDLRFGPDKKIKIVVTHWLLFPDVVLDPETGELKPCTRTVLFDKNGQTYRTTSDFAPKRLEAALQLFEPGEWKVGIPFIITERESRQPGRTYHDMRVELPEE
jgi:hypothetical protein